MANLADGTTWDETVPVIGSDRRDGHQEILGLRKGTRIRLAYEHETLAASSAGGEHKKGSAKAYHDDDTSEPTQRPDGATALDVNDDGRLWVDNTTGEILKVWDGATLAFIQVAGVQMASGTETVAGLVAGAITITVGFLPDVIYCMYGVAAALNQFIAMPRDLNPHDIREYTAVNSQDWRFTVNGSDIDIERVSGTITPTGTFFWRAVKYA